MIYTAKMNRTDINKYVYFSFNYPYDFIERIWAGNHLVEHLRQKYDGYCEQYGSGAAFNQFYVNLDTENQKILEGWILENYKG